MPKTNPTPDATIDTRVELRPIASVTPYHRNPRHTEAAVDAVKASIKAYGFNQPIVVDAEGIIIAGHTRYRAVRDLGWEQVPVIVADLTAEQAREYRIADNKTGELATWDLSKLIPELREIGDLGSMTAYFPDTDLNALLAETSGSMYQPPTETGVREREKQMNDRFTTASKEAQSGYVDVTCPECGHDFAVERAAVLRRTDLKGDWSALEIAVHAEQRPVFERAEAKVRRSLIADGHAPHANREVWLGQVLEMLAAEYLAGPDEPGEDDPDYA